jgi:plastocyanin
MSGVGHLTRRRGVVLSACVDLIPWLAGADASAPPPAQAAATIVIRDFMFAPDRLVVSPGAKVTWKNLDAEPHTVRSIDDRFRSGALDTNDVFTVTLEKPGIYRYTCSIHPQMVGTILVK